ncbi:MAG: FliI/YscN family ATPase [Defluviimonas sp.]|uniref:FliI/YscN family ATPase n=1 Tax=Albidovulum sp. TaxID=1872424 RepID=UPI002A2EF962|nr:FliI/YscN family ATPase [Defluviimonas sp.]
MTPEFDALRSEIDEIEAVHVVARVAEVRGRTLRLGGCVADWRIGDRARFIGGAAAGGSATGDTRGGRSGGPIGDPVGGEVIALDRDGATLLVDGSVDGVRIGDPVIRVGQCDLRPHDAWIGRIIDPFGAPLDGRPLPQGPVARDLHAAPPAPGMRRALGERLGTGLAAFDTLLPLVAGQRLGLFAGSGVGKSSLLGRFARSVEADVVVVALIGERGREVREFAEHVLGPEGMARSVLVAATSDSSPLVRRRCALAAMCVAEHFRDRGLQVLFVADSITRFAEAHREVALAAGEPPSLRGYPPSTAHLIMSLAERAGPGGTTQGDITAVLTVLVAGSDMEEPVADILRGTLDGHVVLEREIAERGRFPAVNLLRSVSRALPRAASAAENLLIMRARHLLGIYDRAEMMIQAGLYASGSDAEIDAAIRVWSSLDGFLSEDAPGDIAASFARLDEILRGAAREPVAPAPAG